MVRVCGPTSKARKKRPGGEVASGILGKGRSKMRLSPHNIDTNSEFVWTLDLIDWTRPNATSFLRLFPFPGNEVGPSGYQWITPFKGIQIPESRKYLPEESGILSYGIWNTAQNESGIPLTIGVHGQNQSHLAKNSETTSWNPSRIQDCLEFPYMGWSRVLVSKLLIPLSL